MSKIRAWLSAKLYGICQKHFQTSQMAIWFYDMAELGNWYGSKVQIGSG